MLCPAVDFNLFFSVFIFSMGILLGAEEDDEEALMQRALELSLRDMSTDENATYSTDRGDAMVTSDAGEEDEVRTFVI